MILIRKAETSDAGRLLEIYAYYVNMMIAWYFATALAKQYKSALPFLEQQRLDIWTHNKTIQKATESYRIAPERKTCFSTLRQCWDLRRESE